MNRTPLILLLTATSAASALADTIKLKSGETIEGTVKESTATEVLVEVQFSPTIKDTRRIAKSDIAGIARQTNDEIAFEKIRATELPESAMDSSELKTTVEREFKPFLKKYGYSSRAKDVQKKIETFQADIERLDGGNVKADGVWYDRASFAAEKYQIDANSLLAKIKAAIAANDYASALNASVELQRLYPNSIAFATAFPLVNKAVEKFSQQLNFAIGNLPVVLNDRKQTIERTPPGERAAVEQAMNAEQARADAVAAEAQRTSTSFFAITPFDEKGLRQMQSNLAQLRTTLAAVDASTLANKASLASRANKELSDMEPTAAATTIAQLKAAWPEYEGLTRLEQRLKTEQMQKFGDTSAGQ